MKLYCVQDFLEVERWFVNRREADAYFEKVLYDRTQEKSVFLEVTLYSTTMSLTQLLLASLNRNGWADRIETVRRAKPLAV